MTRSHHASDLLFVHGAWHDDWNYLELDAPHDAMISHLQALADLLLKM